MWTDERVELLRKLWADGCSAGMIACELGGITRNAVIGKVHRLGLSGRLRTKDPNAPKIPARPRKRNGPPKHSFRAVRNLPPVPDRPATGISQPGLPPKLTIDEDDLAIIPIGQRCSLFELRDDRCHFPFGDPHGYIVSLNPLTFKKEDFFYCGGKALLGSQYCGFHHHVCYKPNPERRRLKQRSRDDRIRESKRLEAMAARFGAGLSGVTRDDQHLEDLDGSSREAGRHPCEKTPNWTEA